MTRRLHLLRCGVSAMLLCGVNVIVAARAAAESSRVIAIEEHWELQVARPDADRSAPQTTMVMSPTGDLTDTHFLLTLNHVTVPDYQPGGLQVQLWNGEELVEEKVEQESVALSHSDETVRWIQRLSLANGTLKFEVINGASESWPAFGGEGLSLSATTSLTSLNGYRPAVSLSESQVGYAENRVDSLVLTKLVWITEDGQVHELNAPIPIDTSVGD